MFDLLVHTCNVHILITPFGVDYYMNISYDKLSYSVIEIVYGVFYY